MGVRRYAIDGHQDEASLEADVLGAWVEYDDYAKLEAENEELRGRVAEQAEAISRLCIALGDEAGIEAVVDAALPAQGDDERGEA